MHTSCICPYILYPQSTLYTDWWYKEKLNGTFVNKYCMGWYLSTASSNKFHFYFFYFSFSKMYVFFLEVNLLVGVNACVKTNEFTSEDWRLKMEDWRLGQMRIVKKVWLLACLFERPSFRGIFVEVGPTKQ